jgi:predicted transcriptional regulator
MRGFGDLEAVVMDVMWQRAEAATVREVFEELAESRRIAYTTVMTVMDNLHRKGYLDREMSGRAWSYRPTASREEYTASLMHEALDGAGDQHTALAHFVAGMSEAESQALRAVLRRRGGRTTRR